jgi:hypothetical protein
MFLIIRLETIKDKMKQQFTIQSLIVNKSNEKEKKDEHTIGPLKQIRLLPWIYNT